MKKLLAIFILFFPFTSHAMVYGFMNGKYYDEQYKLKYFCFLDKKCYNINGELVPTEVITGSAPVEAPSKVSEFPTYQENTTINKVMSNIEDLPRCVDLPTRGSYGSKSDVVSCKYTVNGVEQRFDAKFVANVLSGRAVKKLTNGNTTLYVDADNNKI